MPRPTNRLPFALSERSAGTASTLLTRGGKEVDLAVGGVPFLLATAPELPTSVETVVTRKDQFDTEQEPGEQSLSGWWRRSQDSWHEGAGNLYQESRTVTTPNAGFYDSMGLDVFTLGQATLIRQMNQVDSTGEFTNLRAYVEGSNLSLSCASAGGLRTATDKSSAFNVLHAPAAETVVDGFVSGASFYDITAEGTLYEGTVASPGTATSWPLGSAPSRLGWAKARLWVIGANNIWQPDLTLAASTAQDAVFTNPNAGWTYTCMTEGPQAVYFGGHDGRVSSIQAISLADDGTVPALGGAQVTAVFPDGELVQEITTLAGQYIGIGTSKGFRVGVFNGATIVYGPLLITPPGVTGCTAIATQDRFFLVAFATASDPAVAYKVDTGTQVSEGVLPYAKNVYLGSADSSGTITSLAVAGEDVCALDQDGNVWAQHSTDLVDTGFLQTGRIRFRTNERKLFKYLDLETEPLHGSIGVQGLEQGGTQFDIATFSTVGEVSSQSYGISSSLGPQRSMAVKFTLVRDADDATLGPTLHSYLVRAVPAVRPQRLYTLPLLCYDFETGKSGQRYGNEGYSEERLRALQFMEDGADTITLQDFRKKVVSGETVVIDSIRFVQTLPGRQYDNLSGLGGILILQLRTVTA